MASDYGRNFGFRRSDESLRLSEGRFKTPVGSALLLGTAVEINAASPGYLKAVPSGDKNKTPLPGFFGLLVQEEIFIRSTYDTIGLDSYDLNLAKADKLSVITSGAGVKVWFKNTGSETRADGRSITAVTMADLTTGTPGVGDSLGWDGTKWLKSDHGSTVADWMTITSIDAAGGYVEAVLNF